MHRRLSRICVRSLKSAVLSTIILTAFSTQASEYRLGLALGYGGAGATQPQTIGTGTATVERSEGPGMFEIFVDRLISDSWEIALEHERGFRIGPFSSDVSFTGLATRWYFWAPAPAMNQAKEGESSLLVKRYIPFVGVASGVALADISRKNDLAPGLSGSGIYFGIKLGFDYQFAPGVALRPEIAYATTLMSSESPATTLSEFALQLGVIFDL